jgi:RNA-binding protein
MGPPRGHWAEQPPSARELETMPLNGKQRRYLRSLGHHLEPVVQIGKQGLTDGVIGAVAEALEQHELVKVRIGTECPEDRHEVAERLGPATGGEVAQLLGRTMLVYRRHPKEPKIKLPRE